MSDHLPALLAAAAAAQRNAYAPYSGFAVGAAVRTEDGRIFAGCNVENAAYQEGQCAEASAIGVMAASGGRRIIEALVIGGREGDGQLCPPCGGCLQRLSEFAGPDMLIHLCGPEGLRCTMTLGALLPLGFSSNTLKR